MTRVYVFCRISKKSYLHFNSFLFPHLLFLSSCSQGISRNGKRGIRRKMEKSIQSKYNYTMINIPLLFFFFSVQDFLDKAKKDFEEKWAKNPQVSLVWSNYSFFECLLFMFLIISIKFTLIIMENKLTTVNLIMKNRKPKVNYLVIIQI